jgi:hypothetical protein
MAELITATFNWTPCPSSVVQIRRQASGETEQKQIQNEDTKCSRQLRNSRPIDRENSDNRNASPVQYYYYYYCYYRSLPSKSTEQPFDFQNKIPLRSMNSRNKTGDRERHQNMNQMSSAETTTSKTQKLEAKQI